MTPLERYRSFSPRAQLMLWMGVGVIVLLVLVACYFLFLRRPYDVLFNNLRTMDAATIVAQLEKDKVPYRLEDGGATILVPKDAVDQTRLNIMSSDLPLKGMVGFELFNKSDMGLTEFAQRINYQRALQGELARTIMTLDAVDAARVHLSLPEPTVFREDRRAPRASITIQTRPGKSMSAEAVRGVQRLVAAAVPELSVGDVVVLDQQGEEVSGAGPAAQGASGGVTGGPGVEGYYATKISEALARDYPKLAVRVQVWADVDLNQPPQPPPADGAVQPPSETATARPYRLRISVFVPAETPEVDRQAVRATVVAATDLDLSRGDSLSILGDPLQAVAPASAIAAAPQAGAPLKGNGPSLGFGLFVSIALALLVAVGGAIVFLGRRGVGPRPLAEAEREALSRDLRRLLDERTADASVR